MVLQSWQCLFHHTGGNFPPKIPIHINHLVPYPTWRPMHGQHIGDTRKPHHLCHTNTFWVHLTDWTYSYRAHPWYAHGSHNSNDYLTCIPPWISYWTLMKNPHCTPTTHWSWSYTPTLDSHYFVLFTHHSIHTQISHKSYEPGIPIPPTISRL